MEEEQQKTLHICRNIPSTLRTILLLLTLSSIFNACQAKRSEESLVLKKKDNVVVILIDTLRADHLSAYGYKKETAPYLSSLAKRSVLFENGFSPSSFTAPAVASVFTSLYPSEHGVITGFVATKRHATENGRLPINRISDKILTLPELMRKAGYRTFGLADNFNIVEAQGFSKGFQRFQNYPYVGAEKINETLRGWKAEMQSGEPYFLYLHYMDPHSPYHERKPWFQKGKSVDEDRMNAYDSEIRYLDEHIAKISKEFGWEENALVVVLADHGEEFLEHGHRGHGKTLYTEVLHVPFFWYHRDLSARRIAEDVQTTDLLPTLAAEVGAPMKSEWRGANLQAVLSNQQASPAKRELYSELLRRPEHPRDPKRAVLFDKQHLIHSWSKKGEESHELYDLHSDFYEQKNVVEDFPKTKELGEKHLNDFVESSHSQAEESSVEMDAKAMEHLKSLGYLE